MPLRVVYSAELIGKRQMDAFVLIEDDLFTITYIYIYICVHTHVCAGDNFVALVLSFHLISSGI